MKKLVGFITQYKTCSVTRNDISSSCRDIVSLYLLRVVTPERNELEKFCNEENCRFSLKQQIMSYDSCRYSLQLSRYFKKTKKIVYRVFQKKLINVPVIASAITEECFRKLTFPIRRKTLEQGQVYYLFYFPCLLLLPDVKIPII